MASDECLCGLQRRREATADGNVVSVSKGGDTCVGRFWAVAETLSVVGVAASLIAMVMLAVLDHPHRSVILLVVILFALAAARIVWPGRPWFASRHRWFDVIFYGGFGAAVWLLSPFTATMPPR